jgi:hypothetical protein
MPTPIPSLPSPRTWAFDDLITVPRLRADVENAVAFLGQRPLFVGQATNGGSIPSNTDTAMQMQAELTDAWAMHVTQNLNGATPSQVWAPVPGWYLCRNTVAYAAGSGAYQIAAGFQGTVNGAAYGPVHGGIVIDGSSTVHAAQAADLIEQVNSGAPGGSGDYIQPVAWQDSAGSLNLSSGSFTLPTCSVRWACALTGTQPLPVPPLTAVPSPITSSWMNANVRDAIRFLAYPPCVKAYYVAGSASMPSNTLATAAVVPCNTVALDNYGGWNASTFTYTAPVAGIYIVYGQFNLTTSSTTTTYAAGLSVAGGTTQWGDIVTYAPGAGASGGATVSRRLRLTAGQTVQLLGSQGSGGSLAYAASAISQSRFIAVWDGI